jgi:hypothetical protein
LPPAIEAVELEEDPEAARSEAPSGATAAPESAAAVTASVPDPAEAKASASAAPTETRAQAPQKATDKKPPDIGPLVYTGSFFSRYELREGYEEHGLGTLTSPRLHREGDTFVYRARFGIETQPVRMGKQAVSVKFVPQAHGTHSTQGTPTTGDSYDLRVQEAYMRLQGSGFRLDLGRFAMDYGDALVIGQSNWSEASRAFQGGRVRLTARDNPDYYTDIFATLVSEGSLSTGSIFSGDQYFYGAYTGLGQLGQGPNVDAYLLGRTWAGASGPSVEDPAVILDQDGATHLTIGGRVTQEISLFDYRLEAGLQFGQSLPPPGAAPQDHLAFQIDGGAGISPLKELRIGLGGTVLSGEEDPNDNVDRAWDELFPTGYASLGYTDVILQRSNILSGNLEVSYKAMGSLLLRSKAYLLARFVENLAGNRYVATEIDTDVIHTIGPGATLRGTYSIFLPSGDYWGADLNPPMGDPIHLFEAQLGYEF